MSAAAGIMSEAAEQAKRRALISRKIAEAMRKLAFTSYHFPKPENPSETYELQAPNRDFDFTQTLPECLKAEDDLNEAMRAYIEGRIRIESVQAAFLRFKDAHRARPSEDDLKWLAEMRERAASRPALPPAAPALPAQEPQEPPGRAEAAPARKQRSQRRGRRKASPEGASLFGEES